MVACHYWHTRKWIHSIIFIKYFLSARHLLFRWLTVISSSSTIWGTMDLYVIAALCALDCSWPINSSETLFQLLNLWWYKFAPYYVLLSISLYALCKTYKSWVLFFEIVKLGKVLEPRDLTTVFFSQIVSVEKNNQDQPDIVIECFCCFCLWIFHHLCVLFLRFGYQIHFV